MLTQIARATGGEVCGDQVKSSLISRCAADIEPEKVEWLWHGRLARGKHTCIAGEPGTGKSQLSIATAAAISTGGDWPCGEGSAPLGSIIILSAEDGAADTIVPRLIAAGADLERVHIISAVDDNNGKGRRSFNLQSDLDKLEKKIAEVGDVALIVMDPISSYMGKTDSHKNADVRGVLEPIAEMADRTRVAVLTVTHFAKPNGGTAAKAHHKFIGSIAFVAAARAAFVVLEDSKNKDRRLFLHAKNNLAEPPQGLAFRLEQRVVGEGLVTSRVDWEPEPLKMTADEALAVRGNGSLAVKEAEDFLQTLLSGGPVPSK
ncbi:MAG TPA: AAA family ATPase, partial [Phycisphaerae bacterium]|nr:AAA family ATPase [Phycisphaerae bacterium]